MTRDERLVVLYGVLVLQAAGGTISYGVLVLQEEIGGLWWSITILAHMAADSASTTTS